MSIYAALELDVAAPFSVQLIRVGEDSFGTHGAWFRYADGESKERQFWVPMPKQTAKRLARYLGESVQLIIRPEQVYDA